MRAERIQENKNRHLVLWGLVLAALSLRLIRLTFQPLWWDEGWSLYFATTDIRTLLELTAVDIHPPLYYLLLHFWIQVFGSSVVSVRMLSVLIGTATVPLLYMVGRRLLGDKGGLVAAGLLVISPFHLYYSQEVRMYGLVTLLGLGTWYFALRWRAGESRAKAGRLGVWVGYVLAATAALYTQYYAGFLILALNLVVLVYWRRSRRPLVELASWLGAQLAVFLLFLPWLWYAGEKLLTYIRFKVSVEQDAPMDLITYLARHLAAFDWGHAEGALAGWWWMGLLPLAILGLALALGAWSRAQRNRGRDQGPGIGRAENTGGRAPSTGHPHSFVILHSSLIVAVVLSCGFFVNLLFPFNPPQGERLLLLALPAYLIFVAAALLWVRRHRWLWGAISAVAFLGAAIVSLSFFYTVPRYPDDDYRPVAARVRALGLPSDAILCVHPWQVGYFQAYIPDDQARPALVLTPREVIPHEQQVWADAPERMATELDTLLAEHGRLWLADHRSMGRVLEAQIEVYLVEHAYPVLSEWYGPNTVLSFFATGQPLAQPVTADFGGWLALEGAGLSPGPLAAGWGVVAVELAWQLSEQPVESYTVGLRLAGPTTDVWAQRDSPPFGGLEPFSAWPVDELRLDPHGLLVPAGTPPGEYRLTLRVYNSQDLAVLPVTFSGGSGGEVTLGSVLVVRPQIPPPVQALSIEQPLVADFGDRLRLLGSNVADDSAFLPGESVAVDLFWQALADPGEDFLPRLQLLDAEGRVVAERIEKPVAGTYPTAWWQAGELVRDPHALPIPATVSPGRYRLVLSLIRAADGLAVQAARGQDMVQLAEIEITGRDHHYEPTTPEHAQAATFGTSVELTGYDLEEGSYTPGAGLAVTLHWHALETPDRDYHSFVHLLDAGDQIVAQHDGPPGNGELPTLGWLPGEYLTDTHPLQLPLDLPSGEYRLGVGLYDPVHGQRLGEQVILDSRVPVCAVEDAPCP